MKASSCVRILLRSPLASAPSKVLVAHRLPISLASSSLPLVLPHTPFILPHTTARYASSLNVKKRTFYPDIPFQLVQVRDEATNTLLPPTRLDLLASSTDLTQNRIELVSADPPIVRVITSQAAYNLKKADTARAKEERKKQSPKLKKQLQLTWGVAGHDLERKLDQARECLVEGHKLKATGEVTIVISKKKRGMNPPREEMVSMIDHIVSSLADVGVEKQRNTGNQFSTIQLVTRKLTSKAVASEPPDVTK